MIFYFSGTGNTRWVAEQLADATKEQLIWIPDAIQNGCDYKVEEGERVGFCFPVHGWRPPLIVRDLIRKLTLSRATFTYALVTAGDTIGETITILEHDLKERGITLDSAFSLLMPESYVGLPFMDVDNPKTEKEKKEKAAQMLNEAIPTIIDREKGIRNLVIGNWPRINSRIIGSFFLNHLITDKPFWFDEKKCIKCGRCKDVCPVDNISGGKGLSPTWKHTGNCLTCFACYHHCPTHAIEFGNRTKHKGQYYFKKI